MNLHSASVASVVWRPHSCISWESCWTSGCHGNEGRWDPWDPWEPWDPWDPWEPWDPWDSGIRSRGQIQEPSFEPRHLQSGPVLVLYSYRKSMAQWHRYFLHFLRLEVIVGRVTEIHSLAWGVLIHWPGPVELWPWSRDQEIKGGEKML